MKKGLVEKMNVLEEKYNNFEATPPQRDTMKTLNLEGRSGAQE